MVDDGWSVLRGFVKGYSKSCESAKVKMLDSKLFDSTQSSKCLENLWWSLKRQNFKVVRFRTMKKSFSPAFI